LLHDHSTVTVSKQRFYVPEEGYVPLIGARFGVLNNGNKKEGRASSQSSAPEQKASNPNERTLFNDSTQI
jgi:hypothetical protein